MPYFLFAYKACSMSLTRRLLLLGAAILIASCGGGANEAPSATLKLTAKDVEINNRGVALMGYFDYAGAREAFREAVDRQPQWADVKVNLAIATLNRQMDGDEELARGYLDEVLAESPDNLRAHFVAGLLAERAGETARAKQHYQTVLSNDPEDAYAAYYLAVLTQTEDPETALALFERAIENDPYLRSAYYGAFLLNVRSGDREAGLVMQGVYERLADNPRARLAETKYTRMGGKANALAVDVSEPEATSLPDGPLFLSPQTVVTFDVPRDRSLTTVDLAGNGLQDIFVATPEGPSQVILAGEDVYQEFDHVLTRMGSLNAVAWGDVDNDGMTDVVGCGVNQLQIKFQTAVDKWTRTQNLASLSPQKSCSDVQLLDADHDGDLDVFLSFASGGHDVLSNNGDRSFRSLRSERGLAFSEGNGRNLVAADIDGDRDTDLLVVNAASVDLLFNDRLWDYTPASEQAPEQVPDTLLSSGLMTLTAADANADGRVELYGITKAGQLIRWSRDGQKSWSSRVLSSIAIDTDSEASLDVSDFNGDGVLDLLVVDAAGLKVLGLTEAGVTTLFDYAGNVSTAMHLVADADQGPSLLALVNTATGQQLLRFPPGPGRGKFVALTFEGQEEKADSMRSNRMGVGTRVAVRRGSSWTIVDTFDRHTGRGQSAQPLSVGLGTSSTIDYVAIDWSDGVFQTELNLAAGKQHSITETQRQLSSCPVLFAWDGTQWSFISDLLGVGGIGFLHDPGAKGAARYGEPRPWEYFLMPQEWLKADDGQLKLKVTEPMEELALLDNAQLVAYDLAPGWKMVLDERMATGAPLATGKAQFYRSELKPSRVVRDDGLDLTESVAETDYVAADLGLAHPRFLGMLETPHTLTLEFDQRLDGLTNPLLLRATGWVEYPYSQTVFAAWQTGALYTPPSLEAGDDDGNWTMLLDTFGYPAGMPREMSVELGRLPPGTTRLRLSGNLEIYWDELSLVEVETPGAGDVQRQRLYLQSAELGQTGFPKRKQQPQRRPDYDFSDRVPFWDARYPEGHYTQLGDVMPLLEQTDGAYVTVGPGEDVELAFNAPTGLQEDWTRHYVFFVSGYAKDMDMYTQDSGSVGPLPHRPSSNDSLHNQYNTRYKDGH
ncbi:MAG: FG-GAP-like repeat-containing protein [Gammaproteobacteria bacterium]